MTDQRPRRGWRERVDTGVYRDHRIACSASARRRLGRRCDCPWSLQCPAAPPRRSKVVRFVGTLAEARRERHRLLGAGRPAAPADPLATPRTLDELAGRYLQVRSTTLAPATIATTEHHYVARVTGPLGGLTLGQLDRARIEAWVAAMVRADTSRYKVAKSVAALRVILTAAVEWELIERNFALGLRLPAPETQDTQAVERVLGLDQVRQLRDRGLSPVRADGRPASPRAASMIMLALESGLRRGEVIGLRWPDLDLAARALTVRRSVSQTSAGPGQGFVKTVKSTKGRERRDLVISAALAERLADWFAVNVIGAGAPADGYVFPGRDGDALDKDSPGQLLARVLDRAGLTTPGRPAPVTFHGLRHTCASILFGEDIPLIVISRHLGHANPQVTATVYAHLIGDEQLARAGETVWQATSGMRGGMRGDVDGA